MNILLTGAMGYIGVHIVDSLIKSNYKLFTIDIVELPIVTKNYMKVDCTNLEDLDRLFKNNSFDMVIHLASIVSPSVVEENPLLAYDVNVVGTLNILKMIYKYGIKKLIYFSSSAVYGNLLTLDVITEDNYLEPVTLYGKMKLISENIIQDFAKTNSSLSYIILRPFTVVGTSIDNYRASYLTPFDIAFQVIEGKRDAMVIFGDNYPTYDGTCIRDYIHINDMTNICIKSVEYLNDSTQSLILNCGGGKGYSLKDVVREMEKELQKIIKVVIGDSRENEMISQIADMKKVKMILNYECRYSNIENIVSTYKVI